MSEVNQSTHPEHAGETAIKDDPAQSAPNTSKILIEFAPLILFFLIYKLFDIYAATAVLIVATLASIIISYLKFRRVEIMPLVSAGIITGLGGLTIYLNDDTFVKMKPTIVYVGFGLALAAATFFGYRPIKAIMSASLRMEDRLWTQLQILWSVFFLLMAALNEFIWRSFSTDTWVSFKVFGFLPITLVFAATTIAIFIQRTESPDGDHSS